MKCDVLEFEIDSHVVHAQTSLTNLDRQAEYNLNCLVRLCSCGSTELSDILDEIQKDCVDLNSLSYASTQLMRENMHHVENGTKCHLDVADIKDRTLEDEEAWLAAAVEKVKFEKLKWDRLRRRNLGIERKEDEVSSVKAALTDVVTKKCGDFTDKAALQEVSENKMPSEINFKFFTQKRKLLKQDDRSNVTSQESVYDLNTSNELQPNLKNKDCKAKQSEISSKKVKKLVKKSTKNVVVTCISSDSDDVENAIERRTKPKRKTGTRGKSDNKSRREEIGSAKKVLENYKDLMNKLSEKKNINAEDKALQKKRSEKSSKLSKRLTFSVHDFESKEDEKVSSGNEVVFVTPEQSPVKKTRYKPVKSKGKVEIETASKTAATGSVRQKRRLMRELPETNRLNVGLEDMDVDLNTSVCSLEISKSTDEKFGDVSLEADSSLNSEASANIIPLEPRAELRGCELDICDISSPEIPRGKPRVKTAQSPEKPKGKPRKKTALLTDTGKDEKEVGRSCVKQPEKTRSNLVRRNVREATKPSKLASIENVEVSKMEKVSEVKCGLNDLNKEEVQTVISHEIRTKCEEATPVRKSKLSLRKKLPAKDRVVQKLSNDDKSSTFNLPCVEEAALNLKPAILKAASKQPEPLTEKEAEICFSTSESSPGKSPISIWMKNVDKFDIETKENLKNDMESEGDLDKEVNRKKMNRTKNTKRKCDEQTQSISPSKNAKSTSCRSSHQIEKAVEQEIAAALHYVNISDVKLFVDGRSSLAQKFNLTGNLNNSRFAKLRAAFDKVKHFPPSFLYGQLSQALATCVWENDLECADLEHSDSEKVNNRLTNAVDQGQRQLLVAAYLTESVQVTFRHQLNRNLQIKLKKSSYQGINDAPEAESVETGFDEEELTGMREAVNSLRFTGNVEEDLKSRLSAIPSDWTVVQMTMVAPDPLSSSWGHVLITRLTSDLQPLTVGVPWHRMQWFQSCLKVFHAAVHLDEGITNRQEYWTSRNHKDLQIKNLVLVLQEKFLSGHHLLLQGCSSWSDQPSVKQEVTNSAQVAVDMVKQLHQHDLDIGTVTSAMSILLTANAKDVMSVLSCLWTSAVAKTVGEYVLELQRCLLPLKDNTEVKRGPVLLILDKTLSQLPWESLPCLSDCMVSRVPSLAALHALLCLHSHRRDTPFMVGVDPHRVVAVVNPESNLNNTSDTLVPQFEGYKGWTCLNQTAPSVADLKGFLMDHDMYIYCGHGWGKQFVGGDDLQMFKARAVAVLMGCHSAKLEMRPRGEGDGAPFYFLLAGCPAVVGNLWLVTDRDIDKFTSALASEFMRKDREPVALGTLVQETRSVCRLGGLNGFAPVVYGLPITLKGPL